MHVQKQDDAMALWYRCGSRREDEWQVRDKRAVGWLSQRFVSWALLGSGRRVEVASLGGSGFGIILGIILGWWAPGLGLRTARDLRSQRTSWKGDTGFREWRKKRETQIIGVGAGGVIGHHESCPWSFEISGERGGVGTLISVGTGALVWASVSRVSVRTRADPGTCGGREHLPSSGALLLW
jgi:hypothetical protein